MVAERDLLYHSRRALKGDIFAQNEFSLTPFFAMNAFVLVVGFEMLSVHLCIF